MIPAVARVRCYHNLVYGLLEELPLFTPLGGANPIGQREKELNVTIFGSGEIGTEMFLAAYWYG